MGIQWNIGAARFENGQQADDEILRTLHCNSNQRFRLHAQALKVPRDAIGAFVEFTISQLPVIRNHGDCIRSEGSLVLEHFRNGAVARIVESSSIQLRQLVG